MWLNTFVGPKTKKRELIIVVMVVQQSMRRLDLWKSALSLEWYWDEDEGVSMEEWNQFDWCEYGVRSAI